MPQRLAYTVEEVADILDCGRTTVFKLIRTGRLRAVKIFECTRVTDDDLRGMLAELPSTLDKSAGPAERSAGFDAATSEVVNGRGGTQ